MNPIHVYIVKCSDGLFYTGVTNNLNRRIIEHNAGEDPRAFTYRRRPLKLVFSESFSDPIRAFQLEKQIKGWSRRKKQALIDRNWELLIEDSKRKK